MSSTDETVRNKKIPVVAIAGATGAVGVELMACLEQAQIPAIRAAPAGVGAFGGQENEVPRQRCDRAGAH